MGIFRRTVAYIYILDRDKDGKGENKGFKGHVGDRYGNSHPLVAISAGNAHTVGLKTDGTVIAIGLMQTGGAMSANRVKTDI